MDTEANAALLKEKGLKIALITSRNHVELDALNETVQQTQKTVASRPHE
mgnify:CR=1 FL=1